MEIPSKFGTIFTYGRTMTQIAFEKSKIIFKSPSVLWKQLKRYIRNHFNWAQLPVLLESHCDFSLRTRPWARLGN